MVIDFAQQLNDVTGKPWTEWPDAEEPVNLFDRVTADDLLSGPCIRDLDLPEQVDSTERK